MSDTARIGSGVMPVVTTNETATIVARTQTPEQERLLEFLELLDASHLSQARIADICDTTAAKISRMKNGHEPVTDEVLETLRAFVSGTTPAMKVAIVPQEPDVIMPYTERILANRIRNLQERVFELEKRLAGK